MTAFLRSLIAGVLYPMVPIFAEVLVRVDSEVRLETWVITAVVYFAAIGLASSSRVVSELSLWFTGIGALGYGSIALSVQLKETLPQLDLTKLLEKLPILTDGSHICGILILAFTVAYGVERYKRHVINGEEF